MRLPSYLPNALAPAYFASIVIMETASVGGIEALVSTLFHGLSHPHPFDWFMGHLLFPNAAPARDEGASGIRKNDVVKLMM